MSDDPDFIDAPEIAAAVEQGQTVEQDAATILRLRADAYKRVFHGADPADVALVMDDLTRFCRGFETTYNDIPSRQQHAEGRREVWLRIMDFTRLDVDALFLRYHKPL